VIVYLSEVHEFELMPVEVVDDAGRTTHVEACGAPEQGG
jgi:hypothetical protein